MEHKVGTKVYIVYSTGLILEQVITELSETHVTCTDTEGNSISLSVQWLSSENAFTDEEKAKALSLRIKRVLYISDFMSHATDGQIRHLYDLLQTDVKEE